MMLGPYQPLGIVTSISRSPKVIEMSNLVCGHNSMKRSRRRFTKAIGWSLFTNALMLSMLGGDDLIFKVTRGQWDQIQI